MEKKIVYIHGLTEKITRDQLELNLEEFADCAVNEVMYGLDPSLAVVVFDEPLGKYCICFRLISELLTPADLRSVI